MAALSDRARGIPSSLVAVFLAGMVITLIGSTSNAPAPVVPADVSPPAQAPPDPGQPARPEGGPNPRPASEGASAGSASQDQPSPPPDRVGGAEPLAIRCRFEGTSCRLEIDVVNASNGDLSWVEVRYQVRPRGLEEPHEGRIAEGPGLRLLPGEMVTLAERVPGVQVGRHVVEACVVRFVWHALEAVQEGLSVETNVCIVRDTYVNP